MLIHHGHVQKQEILSYKADGDLLNKPLNQQLKMTSATTSMAFAQYNSLSITISSPSVLLNVCDIRLGVAHSGS